MARRCPICRSRQWHKEAATGLVTCSEGHVLQNYRNETTEATNLGLYALRKRTLKSGRVSKDDTRKGDPALYHGARAHYLYFESLQLILRVQIRVLIEEWKLPVEFEVTCKDIWALHLSLLSRSPNPEWVEDSGQDDKQTDSSGSASDSDDGPDDQRNSMTRKKNSDNKGEGEKQGEKDEAEAILDDLINEAEAIASESETDTDFLDEVNQKRNVNGPKGKARNIYEAPAGNIAVLMMACWTMRVPVVYRDFIRMIEAYKLPYLDGVRVLPGEMRRHLAKETVRMLNPLFPPTVSKLHKLTSRLVRLCWTRLGIRTPEVNGAVILWRVVRALRGTATLYDLAKSTARELHLPLTAAASLAPELVQKEPRQPRGDNVPVEVGLVGVVIVVLKMVYGLDGVKRLGVAENDPASALPTLERYIEMIRSAEPADGDELFLDCGKMINMETLENTDIDRYLEFCQKALLGSEDGNKILGEYFPLGVNREGNSPRAILTGLGPRTDPEIYAGSEETETGRIRIYKAADKLGSVPCAFEVMLETGAKFTGVSGEEIARIVQIFERRLNIHTC